MRQITDVSQFPGVYAFSHASEGTTAVCPAYACGWKFGFKAALMGPSGVPITYG
ncbi:hypothetical protein ART_3901 [Arthrobacter sp. PAMC 25486]|nr:hypothetical protein ART_3901 [Arthrobacter sp. PAMC 25486]